MDNFKIIYKILKILENAMDVEAFDGAAVSLDAHGISTTRRNAYGQSAVSAHTDRPFNN
jgi:hypothetical protein